MNHNPYSPPASNVSETKLETTSRPFAVWLFLGMLSLTGASLVIGIVKTIWTVALYYRRIEELARVALISGAIIRAIAFAAVVLFMISIFQRKKWSRWIAVIVISFVIGAIAVQSIVDVEAKRYVDAAYGAGVMTAKFIVPLMLGWWIYCAAFSAKAKRYFGAEK